LELRVPELVVVEQRIVALGGKHCLQTGKPTRFDGLDVLQIFPPIVSKGLQGIDERVDRGGRTLARRFVHRVAKEDEIIELKIAEASNQREGAPRAVRVAAEGKSNRNFFIVARRRGELTGWADRTVV
jgi:hypothetical protein